MGDMDSGNSGSMQSSSTGGGGDDQEYESRGESSFPSFFNPPNFQVNPFDNARLLQLYSLNNGSSSSNLFDHHQQQGQQQQVGFDSLEGNFMGQNNNPSNNSSHLDMVWANKFGSIRSTPPPSDEATCTNTNNTTPGYNNSNNNPMSTAQVQVQVQLGGHAATLANLQGTTTGSGVPSAENSPRSSTQNQNQNTNLGGGGGGGGGPGRNPKKRSRASRRAPTTVLTTDTSNFRQMVQEFTGIPAPPFSAPGFSTRTRLDLFGGMGMGMGMGLGTGLGMGILPRPEGGGGGGGSTSLDPPPPSYLLRPFAQKILPVSHPHPTPLLNQQQRNTGTSTSASATALAADTTAGASSSPASGNTSNLISSPTGGAANGATFHLSPQNVMHPPNPMFTFQPLLQSSSSNPSASDKYRLPLIQQDSGMDALASKPAGSGSGSGPRGESETQSWSGLHQGLGLTHDHHLLHPPHQTTAGSVNEGAVGNLISSGTDAGNTQRGAAINGTSDNHGGVVRGDQRGMVDSWICSSD